MRILDTALFSKEIHFPIIRALYRSAPKRTWLQKIIRFFTYRRWYEFMFDYVLWVPSLDGYIFIPATFICDNASVPKLLSGLFNSDGMLLLGGYAHDFGYRYKCLLLVDEMTGELYRRPFAKFELDNIFEELCVMESKFPKASKVARITLGIAGHIGWLENRKANNILENDFPGLFVEI